MEQADIQAFDVAFEQFDKTLAEFRSEKYSCVLLTKQVAGRERGQWLCQVLDFGADRVAVDAYGKTPSQALCEVHKLLLAKLETGNWR